MPQDITTTTTAAPARGVLSRAASLRAVAAELALIFVGGTLPTPLYGLYQQQFRLSEIVLTLLFAVYVVGALAALFLLGRASDQIGRRRVLLPALAIAAISTLAFLLPVSLPVLFAGRFLSGMAIGVASGTATAWIAELEPGGDQGRATVIAVASNMTGLAVGPLVAGFLAQYASDPLRLVYAVYLALLLPAAFLAARIRETIAEPATRLRDLQLRPRLGVPAEIRPRFVSPAVTAFAIFSLMGFSTGLTPTVLAQSLHEPGPANGGFIVFELFAIGAVTAILARRLAARTAMVWALLLLLPTLALLVLAESLRSMPILLADTALAGLCTSLGYRGSLQAVNEIAPEDRRAELVSSYLVACYAGVSLPVIGIAAITQLADAFAANLIFAVVIAIAAVGALAVELRYGGPRS
jgi:MFS family permease